MRKDKNFESGIGNACTQKFIKHYKSFFKYLKSFSSAMVPLVIIVIIVQLSSITPVNINLLADGIKPGKRKATLVLSDGRKIELEAGRDTILNASPGVKIKIDSSGVNYIMDTKTPINQNPNNKIPLKKKQIIN